MKRSHVILLLVIAVLVWAVHWVMSFHRPASPVTRDLMCLKQIGLACRMYAEEHRGQYPPDWTRLAKDLGDSPQVFVCWHERGKVGAMSNVMAWTSFRCVPGATIASSPNRVVAYLLPREYGSRECTICERAHFAFRQQERFHVGLILYADGSVSSESPDDFQKVLNEPAASGATRPRPPLPGSGRYDSM